MKVARPNTDQEAEFHVYINNAPCNEFVLPSVASTAPLNIAQCFIAVKPGDQLSIRGAFTGTLWSGTFDLVADGSFLHESRVEGRAGVEAKYMKGRKVGFEKVLNCPYPPEWASVYPPIAMFEGTLHAKKLEDDFAAKYLEWETPVPGSDQPGIGCLCLTVNIGEDSIAKYHKPDRWIDIDGKSDERDIIGGWRREPVQAARELRNARPRAVIDSGIPPDCQLYFEENPEDSGAGQKRSSKHRKHWQDTRPGLKAWCKFCFHYRTQSALDEAGCVPRYDEVHQLEPATDFKKGTDPKARKKAREEGEEGDGMSPPAKKHLGGTLEMPKVRGTLGGTFHLDGKNPSKSPSAENTRRSNSRGDTEFLRELAKYTAVYGESEAGEDTKYRQRRAAVGAGDLDSGTDSDHEHDGRTSSQRQHSKGGTKVPGAVNSKYAYDRLGEPLMHTETETDSASTSHFSRNGSIALGDHKRSHDLRLAVYPRSSGQVSSRVKPANSSKALPARTRTNSANNTNINTNHHRRINDMPAYDTLPSITELRHFIGPNGCSTRDLVKYFQQHGPFLNESKVQRQFQDIVNDIASTNDRTEWVYLRADRNMRTRRDSSRVATNPPATTATTTPTTRKQVFANAESSAPPAYRDDAPAHCRESFNFPGHAANDESHLETNLPAANTPSTQQPSAAEEPTSYAVSATSDRSRKREVSEMTGHTDTDASTPSKKYIFTSDNDLEQARQRLEATKQRLENERREIAVKKARKDAETQQRKLAFEAEMARRAEKKRIKDEKKRIIQEEKARKAEEKRREEDEKRREEEERAAVEARLKEQEQHAKQRQLHAIQLQQEQEELLFAEEALERERAEVEDKEETYEIPPEMGSDSDDEDDNDEVTAAEESEEELTELTMMHQACVAADDASQQSQRYEFEMPALAL